MEIALTFLQTGHRSTSPLIPRPCFLKLYPHFIQYSQGFPRLIHFSEAPTVTSVFVLVFDYIGSKAVARWKLVLNRRHDDAIATSFLSFSPPLRPQLLRNLISCAFSTCFSTCGFGINK